MSADNWGICPKCKRKDDKRKEGLSQKMTEQYGKIQPEEYSQLVYETKQSIEKKLEPTLREDFGISTNQHGVFNIYYGCQCDVCGLQFGYNHEEIII